MTVVTIEIESDGGYALLCAPDGDYGDEGMELDQSPDGLYSTAFTARTVSGDFQVGGRVTGQTIPIREMTLPINCYGMDESTPGAGIETTISNLRKIFGSPLNPKIVTWTYTSELSGPRTLKLQLKNEIKFSPTRDWNIDGYARAVVTVIAPMPNYEAPEVVQSWQNPSAGTHTGYFDLWNPTDQYLWLEWDFDPATQWQFPDFSFGQEWKWMRDAGADANRMIVTPALTSRLSVMADPMMDPYLNADLSTAAGDFNGVYPMYGVPPYTGSEDDPIVVPVVCNGPAGAECMMTQRRFWSAESGLE